VLLVDDEVNTGGSIVGAVKVCREFGAKDVYLAFTHGFFTDVTYERLKQLHVKEIILTDTIYQPESKRLPNMTVLSVGPLLAEVMERAHEGRSVGELFNE
jgi:ribose-phosphate pyrophosphokinase